jgi:hypothetical protein
MGASEFSFGFTDVINYVKQLSPKVAVAVGEAVASSAIETEDWLKDAIEQQRLGHAPLTKRYLQWKRRHGLDERILIARPEDNYYQSIRARALGLFTWVVGPGQEYAELALWLEYGTRTMLPRPHLSVARRVALEILVRKLKELGFHVNNR